MPGRARARGARAPNGLVVERVDAGGEQLLVFGWSTSRNEPPPLSPAEAEVLALVVEGKSNKQIAKARKTSERTIANQVASLLRKTCASSRFELIRRYAGALRG